MYQLLLLFAYTTCVYTYVIEIAYGNSVNSVYYELLMKYTLQTLNTSTGHIQLTTLMLVVDHMTITTVAHTAAKLTWPQVREGVGAAVEEEAAGGSTAAPPVGTTGQTTATHDTIATGISHHGQTMTRRSARIWSHSNISTNGQSCMMVGDRTDLWRRPARVSWTTAVQYQLVAPII